MENKQLYLYYIGLPSATPYILRWHGPFRRSDAVREVHKMVNRGLLTSRAKYLSICHLGNFGPHPVHCKQPFGSCIRFAALGVPMLARPVTEKDWEAMYDLEDDEL